MSSRPFLGKSKSNAYFDDVSLEGRLVFALWGTVSF